MGEFVVLFPNAFFIAAGMEPPLYPDTFRALGLLTGTLGIGYLCAATDPYQHWPIILVGFLSKILGPMLVIQSILDFNFTWEFAINVFLNDVIWWLPFVLILRKKYMRYYYDEPDYDLSVETKQFEVAPNFSLWDYSHEKPLLIVFNRHAGCTFCRETMSKLRDNRAEIEKDCEIILVHHSSSKAWDDVLKTFELEDVKSIRDNHLRLYESFSVPKGRIHQVLGWKVLRRGILLAGRSKLGLGALDGNAFQLPGVFLFYYGKVIDEYRYETAADEVDFCTLKPL